MQEKERERELMPGYETLYPHARKPALAMAYVPDQEWGDIYKPDVAFVRGTIFPELYKPFTEGGPSHA
ncbi:MAG: spore coat associated protein CotJA [Clostridiales bacterium]|nr:spore coat associated protein CotJA [Clostridiales bacterium]